MEKCIIRIGHQTIIGGVCPSCALRTIIYPESAFIEHQRAHHQPVVYSRKPHHSRGRPLGIHTQYSSAQIFREGIKSR